MIVNEMCCSESDWGCDLLRSSVGPIRASEGRQRTPLLFFFLRLFVY